MKTEIKDYSWVTAVHRGSDDLRNLDPETHLTLAQLRKYVYRELTPIEMKRVSHHIQQCDRCLGIWDSLEATLTQPGLEIKLPRTKLAQSELVQPKKGAGISHVTDYKPPRGWKSPLIAIMVGLALILGATLGYMYFVDYSSTPGLSFEPAEVNALPNLAEAKSTEPASTKEEISSSNQAGFPWASQLNISEKRNEIPVTASEEDQLQINTVASQEEEIADLIAAQTEKETDVKKAASPEKESPIKSTLNTEKPLTNPTDKVIASEQGPVAPDNKETKVAAAEEPAVNDGSNPIKFRKIGGQIMRDDTGKPLAGVKIGVEGTAIATLSDAEGRYDLNVPINRSSLIFEHTNQVVRQIIDSNTQLLNLTISIPKATVAVKAPELLSPSPVTGDKYYEQYLQYRLKYPIKAKQKGISGKVFVAFKVAPDGSLSNFRVTKSLGYGCDKEAIRLVQEGPDWHPAIKNGTPIVKEAMVAVNFNL